MLNDSHYKLETLFSKSFLKRQQYQRATKKISNQKIDPEYFDIDDPESIINSFDTQIEKIKRMCTQSDEDFEKITSSDQIEFDFPSKKTLISIMKYLQISINTMKIPEDLIMNSIIFVFLDKIIQNDSFYERNSSSDQISVIGQATSLYASISLYNYCEPMESIIDKYPIFLLKSTKNPINENETDMFILALSNLLSDEQSRIKLLTDEIHNIIYEIITKPSICLSTFYSCLEYLNNFSCCFDSDEKNNQFFIKLLQFLIENIITKFSPKLGQIQTDEKEEEIKEQEEINILIKELILISNLLDPLIEAGLNFELENCIKILFSLANSNQNYCCLSENLFVIMKQIAFVNNKFTIFTESSFLDCFFNIYKNSLIDAKIQGVDLLIILSSLICDSADFFHFFLEYYCDNVLDSNFNLCEHITFFIISILRSASREKRRELVDSNLIKILTNSIETQIFIKETVKMFLEANEADSDFWFNFLVENNFITILSEIKDDDLDDLETIELIKNLVYI